MSFHKLNGINDNYPILIIIMIYDMHWPVFLPCSARVLEMAQALAESDRLRSQQAELQVSQLVARHLSPPDKLPGIKKAQKSAALDLSSSHLSPGMERETYKHHHVILACWPLTSAV